MKVIHFDEIDSTSLYLTREANNLADLTIVEASFQTAGKGREDRVWISPKDENLMFSILIKDKELIENYKSLSMMSANIVRKYLTKVGIKNISIKWPNDVYANDKKICGILLQGQYPYYLIIGIGINVNTKEFKGEYRTTPTSVALETDFLVDIDSFKDSLYKTLINELESFEYSSRHLLEEVRANNYLKGKTIEQGEVIDIADDFSLLVKKDNKEFNISTGEVEIKK